MSSSKEFMVGDDEEKSDRLINDDHQDADGDTEMKNNIDNDDMMNQIIIPEQQPILELTMLDTTQQDSHVIPICASENAKDNENHPDMSEMNATNVTLQQETTMTPTPLSENIVIVDQSNNINITSTNNTGIIKSYTLIGKYGKDIKLTFDDLDGEVTIGEIKDMIQLETNILPKRQKFVGLLSAITGGLKGLHDDLPISNIKMNKSSTTVTKSNSNNNTDNANSNDTVSMTDNINNINNHIIEIITHHFIIMGTPEESIFIDPEERRLRMIQLNQINIDGTGGIVDDVIDDFDFDYNAGTDEWYNHVSNGINLKKFTEQTPVYIMNEPRHNKSLLVLDLDHTLLDFSRKPLLNPIDGTVSNTTYTDSLIQNMKRPYVDEFLTNCYQHYDIVIWSQTSWRWLETKLIELGFINHPSYKICFVLDKTSMFTITSTLTKSNSLSSSSKQRSSSSSSSKKSKSNNNNTDSITHHVKPLQIIWSKFPNRWNEHNTIHIDDLSRNFALNLKNGLKCKPYYRKKASSGRNDIELVNLCRYLLLVAQSNIPFHHINFHKWYDVIAGNKSLLETLSESSTTTTKSDNKNDDEKDDDRT